MREIPRGYGKIRSIKLLTCFRIATDFPLVSLLNDVISNAQAMRSGDELVEMMVHLKSSPGICLGRLSLSHEML